jgi:competence protein ComEC
MISHPDNDHSAGSATLIKALPVEQVIVGGERPVHPGRRQCRAGQAWRWPSGVTFQVLSPESGEGLSSNNSSCVLQIHIGKLSLLLPGDIDSTREKDLVSYWREILRSDVLLAAHHGSLSSSSYPWLKTVQPGNVVFSHGYLNQFGHPHANILARYRQMASEHLSTAAQGALEIDISPAGEIVVASYRASGQRYWM